MGEINGIMYTLVRFEAIAAATRATGPEAGPEAGRSVRDAKGSQGSNGSKGPEAGPASETAARLQAMEMRRAPSQRRASSDATIRVLATSPANALALSTLFSTALTTGVLTAGMNVAGIEGSAELIGFIYVYRCGVELDCNSG
ncbi:hypothetical protein T484DRAFT_1828988 [Baffinella frigidus]|nr:hypothetical protein T484DRAFT_1828988 [Cryptophyta sp. CCMP2293]